MQTAYYLAVFGLVAAVFAWRVHVALVDISRRLDSLEDAQRRGWLRQDRLQKMVLDRGWRDSHLLTEFDWRRPQ